MRATSLGTISSVTGSHSAAPGSRKVTVCENEPEWVGSGGHKSQSGSGWWWDSGVYIKGSAESPEVRCHVKTLLMKRRQMSAVSSHSATGVGL